MANHDKHVNGMAIIDIFMTSQQCHIHHTLLHETSHTYSIQLHQYGHTDTVILRVAKTRALIVAGKKIINAHHHSHHDTLHT